MASETSVNVLDNVLGITDVVETATSTVTLPQVRKPDEETDNDYKYQRENFYRLVERGQDAIDGILELAKESEHPRTYEVAGQLIKNVADVTAKLGELQLKMQKLKEVPSNAPKNVTNGSTFRVRFQTASLGSGSTVRGNAANSNAYTTVSFERLTDAQS